MRDPSVPGVGLLPDEVGRRDRHIATLDAVAARVQSATDESQVLDAALEEILDQLGLSAAWFLLAEADGHLVLAASRGLAPSYLERVETAGLEPCMCPEVFATGQARQARNTVDCPRMPHLIEDLDRPVAHASVPLSLEGHSRGVLNVAAPPGHLFTDDELRFLEVLGRQVCLGLDRARHQRQLARVAQQWQAMATISKAIGGTLDTAAVLQDVSSAAGQLLGAEQVYVFLGSDPTEVRVGHASGPAGFEEGQRLNLEELGWPLACRALLERQTIRVDDSRSNPTVNRAVAERLGIGSVLITPLVAHDQVQGLIVLARGAPAAWTGEQRDLAAALAAQAAVALENASLYQNARQAYGELRHAQTRMIVSEKMAMLGTFASGLAHEVRNPLNSIALQLSLLERRMARSAPKSAAESRPLVQIIREELQRLDSLVGDFLQFARTTRVGYEPGDLGVLADEVVRLMEPEATAAGVRLERVEQKAPIPPVRLDSERIKQVLINLVRNAIEALQPGGCVRLSVGSADDGAWIRVADDGPGLPEDLDVFQLFVTTKAKGTGLGLPIAQQIVDEHGGEIEVESRPGSGTSFAVWLPRNGATRSNRREE
jgi:signal transduction histidine kinase